MLSGECSRDCASSIPTLPPKRGERWTRSPIANARSCGSPAKACRAETLPQNLAYRKAPSGTISPKPSARWAPATASKLPASRGPRAGYRLLLIDDPSIPCHTMPAVSLVILATSIRSSPTVVRDFAKWSVYATSEHFFPSSVRLDYFFDGAMGAEIRTACSVPDRSSGAQWSGARRFERRRPARRCSRKRGCLWYGCRSTRQRRWDAAKSCDLPCRRLSRVCRLCRFQRSWPSRCRGWKSLDRRPGMGEYLAWQRRRNLAASGFLWSVYRRIFSGDRRL